ncbi:hypothetical protein BOW53_03630 [Solemya pervernicosa gill symbiont]|uniref:Uncharacterized protein n=1 Tax=Solemya pervernicosa gill symbiont TaxID=642797 RepID=A0A1T2L8P8_9GAMM|nr:hypothetical protein BOW53_03630 [Solemya pervernicosa gill symbiont]
MEYANSLIDRILTANGVTEINIPVSREAGAKPMHVYELHVSALTELYAYALEEERRPPPLAVSTPITYTPTDVYYLTQLVINNLEEVYRDSGGYIDFSMNSHSGKSPADVYQELFELYYRLNLLNGKSKVSPNEVYSHIFRAKEDLQFSLLTLSKHLADSDEIKKRLLVTAIYGMHPDGSTMTPLEAGKKPGDVIAKSITIRGKLNLLRKRNKLPEIPRPKLEEFGAAKPIDAFLQTQFIIAELNLLKIPMDISSTTNSAKAVSGKTPSDVYQEMKHIEYMIDRLIQAL